MSDLIVLLVYENVTQLRQYSVKKKPSFLIEDILYLAESWLAKADTGTTGHAAEFYVVLKLPNSSKK